MSLKSVTALAFLVMPFLLGVNTSFAQRLESQQVPGASARLKREYTDAKTEFFADEAASRPPIIIRWTGELDFETAKKYPPPMHGIIDNDEAVEDLWRNWSLSTPPSVDFDKYVMLAAIGGGSGARYEAVSKLTKKGDLRYQFIPAVLVKTGGPGYFIFVVPRDEIKEFQGIAIAPPAQNKAVNRSTQSRGN